MFRNRIPFIFALLVVLAASVLYRTVAEAADRGGDKLPADPQITAALMRVSAQRIQADIEKLVSFQTRLTLSAQDPDSIKAGQALFQKNCRFCHGADAKGNGPMAPEGTHPSNLTDDKWDRGSTDGELFLVVRDGAGPKFDMKGYKSKMSETDIWNIVNYVRSLQGK